MHLNPAAFIDLLDGTTPESAVPHLAVCPACRDQLAALRETHTAVGDVEVPEPSPLFWDHLSARVREAVAAEPVPVSWWGGGWGRMIAVAGAAAVMLMVLIVPMTWRSRPDTQAAAHDQQLVPASPAGDAGAVAGDDSLEFVADVAANVDWDAALDSGLVAPGTAELALVQLDATQRVELQRLLNDAMRKGGA